VGDERAETSRQAEISRQAETYLRLLAEAELRHAVTAAREEEPERARMRAWDGLSQVQYVAAAFVAVDALDAELAARIAINLETALEVRFRLDNNGPLLNRLLTAAVQWSPLRPSPMPAGPPVVPAASAYPQEPVAMPVGRMLRLSGGDQVTGLYLVTLVRAPGWALFNVAGSVSHRVTRGRLLPQLLHQVKLADNRGARYGLQFSGSTHLGMADGWLWVDPAPPPDVGWLEFRDAAGQPMLRINVPPGPTPAAPSLVDAGWSSPAERLLDAVAGDLLGHLSYLQEPGYLSRNLDELVRALSSTGLLPAGSTAPSRLALLCHRSILGTWTGHGLIDALGTGRLPPAALPEPWVSLLAQLGRRDAPKGKRGITPLALVLPGTGVVRFIVTGLSSEPDHASLSALAIGLPPAVQLHHSLGLNWAQWFPWWIMDSTGHWHVATVQGFDARGGELTVFKLRVIPPLSRLDRRMDLLVPDRSGWLRTSVNLDWTAHV
jgi:hypothetical protein